MTDAETLPSRRGVMTAIADGARIWRANPWSTLLVLGIATAAWSIPGHVFQRMIRDAGLGSNGVLAMIADGVWHAPLLAVQLRFALATCRRVPFDGRDVVVGLRLTGHMAIASLMFVVPWGLFELAPSAGADLGVWTVTLVLLGLPIVAFICVRLSMAPILVADTRCGPVETFRRSWTLTLDRFWPLVGFGVLQSLAEWGSTLVAGDRWMFATTLFDLACYPLACLAYANLYEAYQARPELGH
jgi:hypothetical protein